MILTLAGHLLRLPSKCEDHFFNSSLSHTAKTFLSQIELSSNLYLVLNQLKCFELMGEPGLRPDCNFKKVLSKHFMYRAKNTLFVHDWFSLHTKVLNCSLSQNGVWTRVLGLRFRGLCYTPFYGPIFFLCPPPKGWKFLATVATDNGWSGILHFRN